MIRRITRLFLLALPLVILLMWAWSHYEPVTLPGYDTLHYPNEPRGGEVFVHPAFDRGRFRVRYCRVAPGAPQTFAALGPRWGFMYTLTTDNRYKAGAFVEKNFYIPAWALLLPALPYPIVYLWRWLRQHRLLRRQRDGLCLKCGYDLTGNLSGVCPECGQPSVRPTSPTGRPLIVWKTVCTLCSTTVEVPLEARDWARCPNCGALVPI